MTNLVVIKTYRVGQTDSVTRLLVSLPPVWLEKNNIQPGDMIEFCQEPGSNDIVIRKVEAGRESNPQ